MNTDFDVSPEVEAAWRWPKASKPNDYGREMQEFVLPAGAVPARTPREVRLQIVTAAPEPPEGGSWLHEIKHEGHRLVAIVAGGSVRLLSRNGYDRTMLFGEPFKPLAAAGLPPMVFDGEIAVPDGRGVTHIDWLNEAIADRRSECVRPSALRRARPQTLPDRGPQGATP
jgi:ATP-dependent DNA ligase